LESTPFTGVLIPEVSEKEYKLLGEMACELRSKRKLTLAECNNVVGFAKIQHHFETESGIESGRPRKQLDV